MVKVGGSRPLIGLDLFSIQLSNILLDMYNAYNLKKYFFEINCGTLFALTDLNEQIIFKIC
jgi:hypothetical protein